METVENKYITVAYKLYTMEDGEKELFEEAKAEHPFQFISGLGTTLEDFENQITALSKGDKFDFTIPADKAYGQYDEQHVIDLPKNIFEIDGKFDSERIKEGNIVPLMTGDGQRVNASVVCLLYTSDAADEEDSVNLGGRGIIKKKKIRQRRVVDESK